MTYAPATRPTFYFIGVTTGKSSIMKVFPEWARHLSLGDVEIRGIDLVPHDNCLLYTSDAADDLPCVDLGGRRIIKKKQHKNNTGKSRHSKPFISLDRTHLLQESL